MSDQQIFTGDASEDLKDYVRAHVQSIFPELLEKARSMVFQSKYVNIPFELDGVINSVRYNVRERVFDEISIFVYTDESQNDMKLVRFSIEV